MIDAFGLVYAAGVLAKAYGILPETIDCKAAAVHCLRLNLGRRAEADPLEQLLAWVAVNDVTDLRTGTLPSMSDDAFRIKGAFIGECAGDTQLWMSPRLFRTVFENHGAMMNELKRRGILKAETSRKTIKSLVRKGTKPDRVHAFRIPDFEAWLDDNHHPRPKKRR